MGGNVESFSPPLFAADVVRGRLEQEGDETNQEVLKNQIFLGILIFWEVGSAFF